MSAPPSDPADAVPGQDETRRRVHELLSAVVAALLEQQPGLIAFHVHRPERDRSSGTSWHGRQTLCHVSALLVGTGRPDPSDGAAAGLIDAAHRVVTRFGMRPRAESVGQAMTTVSWRSDAGDLLELVLGVRVALRMVSAPFLPGSLDPEAATGPVAALSSVTPPPRRVR